MKILIVDDNDAVLEELSIRFKDDYPKAVVNIALSYDKAIELLKENIYDLILLDGQLNGGHMMDPWQHAFGHYLIEPIKKSLSGNAIIITISGDEGLRKNALNMGAQFSIPKNEFINNGLINSFKNVNLEIKAD